MTPIEIGMIPRKDRVLKRYDVILVKDEAGIQELKVRLSETGVFLNAKEAEIAIRYLEDKVLASKESMLDAIQERKEARRIAGILARHVPARDGCDCCTCEAVREVQRWGQI